MRNSKTQAPNEYLAGLPFVTLENRSNLPEASCIYFAVSSEWEVLYIGRSTNLKHRWLSHHRYETLKRIGGVRILYLKIEEPRLLPTIEGAMIERFNPRLNNTPVKRKADRKPKDYSFSISLPLMKEIRLALWAHTRGISKAQMAKEILVSSTSKLTHL